MFEAVQDRSGQANTLDSLGLVHFNLHRYPGAANHYRRALDLYRALDDHYEEADTLDHLGDTFASSGELRTARRHWANALAILDELKHPQAAAVRAKLATART